MVPQVVPTAPLGAAGGGGGRGEPAVARDVSGRHVERDRQHLQVSGGRCL